MHADFFFDLSLAVFNPEDVAAKVFSALGMSDFESHESNNYACGWYFSAARQDLTFDLSLNEYSDGVSFAYWLSIENFKSEDKQDFEQLVSRFLTDLEKVSARVVRVYDFGKKTMRLFPL